MDIIAAIVADLNWVWKCFTTSHFETKELNKGIIIDCSRYFNKIIKLNLKEEWIEVEPGIILKKLNDILKPHGYHFAPHISPDDRATIGGMISTDACGKGSYVFGKTSDNLISASTILSDGSDYDFNKEFAINSDKGSKLVEILTGKEQLIKEKFPESIRFASGYNLNKLLSENNALNLPYLLSGSEGTLGTITKARLKITKINQHKALIISYYDSFITSLKDTANLLKFKPYAIETMDEEILRLSKKQKLSPLIKKLVNNAKSINILEFQDNSKDGLEKQIKNFLNNFSNKTLSQKSMAFYESREIEQIWNLRKNGVGIAGNLEGNKKPTPFIEDSCVPVEHIADYAEELKTLLKQYKLYHVIYGHLDVGCLHVRPALDLTSDKDKALIRELTPKVIKLVQKYKGIVWGEHSAGFRVEYSPEIFGKEIFDIFCQIKSIFDPDNRLNPGKVAGNELVKIDQNLQAESIEITFDPNKTSYEAILKFFFQIHDPTTLNRQENDIGTQYRSAIFYLNEKQKLIAKKIIKEADESGVYDSKVVTQLSKAGPFFAAEEYHQDYLQKNPKGYTCHHIREEWKF